MHPSTIEAPPGLEGVIVADTEVGDVRGLEGFYHYRQYTAVELADKRRLEDVWFLLFEGHLPQRRRARRRSSTRSGRCARLPDAVVRGAAGHRRRLDSRSWRASAPRSSLVGAVEGYRPTLDIDHAERRRNALQVCAVVPTLITAIHRLKRDGARRTAATTSATAPTTSG